MQDIWHRSLAALSAKLPADHYGDLVRSVVGSRVDDSGTQVTLHVSGRIQRDWLLEHYLELLADELKTQAGRSVQVLVEVTRRRKERDDRAPGPCEQIIRPPAGPVNRPEASASGKPASTNPRLPDPAVPCGTDEPEGVVSHQLTLECETTPSVPSFLGENEPASIKLHARHRFSTFVVGPSNQMAHAASLGVAQNPGRLYNPLFLYGSSGLGKTHLLQAIGHQLQGQQPKRRLIYRRTEDFMNDFTHSLRSQRMEQFRRYYREECDLLLLDDVQFMTRKEQTQQEFFHTFEALLQRGVQLVMTCDRLPREIDQLDERLRSRFTWGLLADIQKPELETRLAILEQKAEADGLKLDQDVALFLAEHFRSNVRELEGTLTRLGAYASFSHRQQIDLTFARAVLKEHLPRSRQLGLEETIRLVAEHYRLRPADLKGTRRSRNVARPRQVAMFLVREVLQRSYPEIGQAFGKDHTTVIAACRRIEKLLSCDSTLNAEIDLLRRRIEQGQETS